MKGLIVKDLIVLKHSLKNLLMMVVLFSVIGWGDDNNTMLISIPFILGMNVLSTFSYDEFSNWDKFALALPVTKKEYVLGKFTIGGILSCSGVLIMTVILGTKMVVTQQIDWLLLIVLALTGLVGSLVFQCLFFPVLFKFPIEKARNIFLVGVAGLSFGLVGLIKLMKIDIIRIANEALNLETWQFGLAVALIFGVVWFLSFVVSLEILKKKFN